MEFPTTWKTYCVNELGDILKGKGIAKDEVLPVGLPCIRYGEIYTTYNNYFAETVSFIDEKSAMQSQEIKNGDILFAGSGETVEEIGKCVAYVGSKKAYAGGDLVVLRPKNVDSIFLAHVLNSDYVVKQKAIFGQGNSVVHIYPNAVGQLIVHLPVLAEQKKIAEILSTWDKAIDKQTKLIAAKEKRKKALMQKLLSGEVRFNGFEEDFIKVKLGQYISLQGGYAFKSSLFAKTGIPVIRISDVDGYGVTISDDTVRYPENEISDSFKVVKGDVLVAMSGATTGKLGRYTGDSFAYLNQRVGKFVIRDNELLDYNYLCQILFDESFQDGVSREIAAGAQPNISSSQIENIELVISPNISEQKTIAALLSACDVEIQKLKTELEALRQQKKGLMQNLLTGKIRVKID